MKEKYNVKVMIFCGLLMLITAASDSLRGIFLPAFRSTFSLSEPQAGRIIMISYVGNLIFLSFGGRLSDRLPRKLFIGGLLVIWAAALAVYTFTENYILLLICMTVSMGGSTMLSTSVNMLTPLMFASPAMLVSIFNFVQGVGITVSQNIIGRFADSLEAWHFANAGLLVIAGICFILLMTMKLPDPEKSSRKGRSSAIIRNPASIFLILICGCYFIAEHGLMNWLTSYGSEHLGYSVQDSAFYLSLFFGGITVGRLIFAPFIEKIGVFRSLLIWSSAGTVIYIAGMALGKSGMVLFGLSGLALSIVYPMLVMLIGRFFDTSEAGSATGFILSIATFFDIGFNALFGDLVKSAGYGRAMIVLPVSAALFCASLFALKFLVRKSKDIA